MTDQEKIDELIKALESLIRACYGLGFLRPNGMFEGHVLPAKCKKAEKIIEKVKTTGL